MLKRRTVATIGPGDVLEQTVQSAAAKAVWACTAVADSQLVMVFEVERELVERLLDTTQLHPTGMYEQRGQHRSRVIEVLHKGSNFASKLLFVQELKTSCEKMYTPGGLMYSQPQVPEDQNLGWQGGYREATLDKEAAKRIASLPETVTAATVPVAAVTKRRRERRYHCPI